VKVWTAYGLPGTPRGRYARDRQDRGWSGVVVQPNRQRFVAEYASIDLHGHEGEQQIGEARRMKVGAGRVVAETGVVWRG
jgi:hypothetical protein